MVPRRGFPHPLRSAFAVSHDLDGFPSSSPVTCFGHTHPWGFGSLFPGRYLPARPKGPVVRSQGTGCHMKVSRLGPRSSGAEASRNRGPAASGTEVSDPAPVPPRHPQARSPIAHRFHGSPSAISPGQVAPSGRCDSKLPQPARASPTEGLPPSCELDQQRRVTATTGRSRRERTLSGPPALPTAAPLDAAIGCDCQLSFQDRSRHPEGCLARPGQSLAPRTFKL